MPYPHAVKIEGFLCKEEVTYGTDPTPTNADDGIRVVGRLWPEMQPEWAFPNDRADVLSNSLIDAAPGTPAGRMVSFEITTELKGAGAPYSSSTPVRPEVDPLLIAAGFSRTHDDTGSSEKVTYANADTGHGSATCYVYAGGKLHKIVGVRANPLWPIEAGMQGRMRFRCQGLLSATPTEVAVPSITYDSVTAPVATGIGLAIVPNGGSSWSPDVRGLEVDFGFELTRLDDVNASDGIEGFFFNRQDPRVSFEPRVVDLSDYNPGSEAASRNDHTIDLTLGGTQYNRIKLDVEAAYLMSDPSGTEDNGFAAWQAEYKCLDAAIVFD